MVLLVHRTKQQDVSLPKGKLDRGESLPQAAVRETAEETGLAVALGVHLGTVEYELPNDGRKSVQYWAAEVTEEAVAASTFVPNREIAALEWLPLKKARKRLSYPADRDILDVFAKLVERDALESFAIILLRHAEAEPRSGFAGADRDRPLTDRGEEHAETVVPSLAAFAPSRVLSSTARRCMTTAEPIAEHLGVGVKPRPELSQDAWHDGETSGLREVVGKTVRKGRSTILCSHRPVLPDLAREVALSTGSIPGSYLAEASALPPGGFSVFHLSKRHPGAGILAVEVYPLEHPA